MINLKEKLNQKVDEFLDNKNLSALDLEIVSRIVINLSNEPTPYEKTMQNLLEAVNAFPHHTKIDGGKKDDDISKVD